MSCVPTRKADNPNSSITAHLVVDDLTEDDEVFDDKNLAWGWRSFKPKWLQWLNSPKWFLFFVCLFTFLQGMAVNSFVHLSLPTLEKRFRLTSKQTGIIVASNDITALILVVFVSFFGSYGHKTKWLGYGAILTGMAALLFALPKLLIGKYQPAEVSSGKAFVCLPNTTSTNLDCSEASSSFNVYFFIFVISQLVAGTGTTPLFSLGPAYLDENVKPKTLSWYLGGFYVAVLLGPGLGSLIGGKLISIYVDLVMPPELSLTPRDPRWLGAWWLGPFCCSFLLIIDGLILLGFPAKLPGSEAIRKKAIEKGYVKKDKIKAKGDLKSLLTDMKDLLTNWTYVFQNLGYVFSSLIGISVGPFFFKLITQRYGATPIEAGSGMAIILLPSMVIGIGIVIGLGVGPFIFKLITQRYGATPMEAGAAIAVILFPSTVIGIGIGSFIVKKLGVRDSCRRAAKATFLFQLLGIWASPLFLIPGCDYSRYAGADVGYFNSSLAKFSLSDHCNAPCHCSTSTFRPICGPEGVSYFSPCFAGCTKHILNKGFTNCSCANPLINKTTMAKSDAVLIERTCHQYCPRLRLYLFIMGGFLLVLVGFLGAIPSKIVTLRSVSENQRALGLGVQFVFLRVIASIPGPIVIGYFIDATCTLWSVNCGSRENCLNYDYTKMGWIFFEILTPVQVLSLLWFGLSWYFAKDSAEPTTAVQLAMDNADADIDDDKALNIKNNNEDFQDATQSESTTTAL